MIFISCQTVLKKTDYPFFVNRIPACKQSVLWVFEYTSVIKYNLLIFNNITQSLQSVCFLKKNFFHTVFVDKRQKLARKKRGKCFSIQSKATCKNFSWFKKREINKWMKNSPKSLLAWLICMHLALLCFGKKNKIKNHHFCPDPLIPIFFKHGFPSFFSLFFRL